MSRVVTTYRLPLNHGKGNVFTHSSILKPGEAQVRPPVETMREVHAWRLEAMMIERRQRGGSQTKKTR
jgi:hypothetical protein